jgi:hypothetical protein
MSFTFDSTVGGASSNSYATVTAFNDYVGGRMDVAEASAAATLTLQQALVMATYRLDAEEYVGVAVTQTQALKWPRYDVYMANGLDTEDETAIPDRVQRATFELALAILKDTSWLSDSGLEPYAHVALGGGAIDVTPRTDRKTGTLPAHVARLLKDIRLGGANAPVVRG